MAQITINEISQTYTYNIGTNSFCTVAMPITSSWGPGYFDPDSFFDSNDKCLNPTDYMLSRTAWTRFPATQAGLEAFVSTYRGPASPWRRAKDYSYQMAMTLLTAGYDVLVCRLCPGEAAGGKLVQESSGASLNFRAKYPGTFGNNLQISIRKNVYFDQVERVQKIYWSIITHIVDLSGVKTSAENISCVFNIDNSSDQVPYYKEIESNFWTVVVEGTIDEGTPGDYASLNAVDIPYDVDSPKQLRWVRLSGGTDMPSDNKAVQDISDIIEPRYMWAKNYDLNYSTDAGDAYQAFIDMPTATGDATLNVDQLDQVIKNTLWYREWLYTALVTGTPTKLDDVIGREDEDFGVFDLLKDKLAYNPNRIIASGWDDQDYMEYAQQDFSIVSAYISSIMTGADCETCKIAPSPLHLKLMDVAYHSRCGTGLIDIPHVVDRKFVHIEDEEHLEHEGYAQKLARVVPRNLDNDINAVLYHTHSALFVPWGQYIYVGIARMKQAAPAFLALMIQRAQLLNQANQYEWALPTNRKHNLKIGKLDYVIPKKILDKWQKLDGASVNVITPIPDLGTNLWGNSTLFEVPPASYQALANLSTRYLVNAVEDTAYRVGIGITFQYNNNQAYNKFYAGVTPLLDTMKNVGAIEDYYVKMAADINGLDQVNANTVVGKIYLVVNGVINDIIVDLIALPPGTDLNQYRF